MSSAKWFPSRPLQMPPRNSGGGLLTPAEAADFLHISVETVKWWRKSTERRGPSYVRIWSRIVRYRLADLNAFIRKRLVRARGRNHEEQNGKTS